MYLKASIAGLRGQGRIMGHIEVVRCYMLYSVEGVVQVTTKTEVRNLTVVLQMSVRTDSKVRCASKAVWSALFTFGVSSLRKHKGLTSLF